MNLTPEQQERLARIKRVTANARRIDESKADWQARTAGQLVKTDTGYRLADDPEG